MEPHRLISVFLQDAQEMPNMRTFQIGNMRLRVGTLVYNPTFGPNSYDRVAHTPTLRLCTSSCNWGGERLDIWCRNSCFLQDGWQLLIVLFHQSEYVTSTVVGIVQISLADLTNPAMKRSMPHIYPMSYNGENRGKLTCAVTVGVPQNVSAISQEQAGSSESSALSNFLVGVLVNLTSSMITGQ